MKMLIAHLILYLRLFTDIIPNMPEKILYLDIDMMANERYIRTYIILILLNYEYAAVKRKIWFVG